MVIGRFERLGQLGTSSSELTLHISPCGGCGVEHGRVRAYHAARLNRGPDAKGVGFMDLGLPPEALTTWGFMLLSGGICHRLCRSFWGPPYLVIHLERLYVGNLPFD